MVLLNIVGLLLLVCSAFLIVTAIFMYITTNAAVRNRLKSLSDNDVKHDVRSGQFQKSFSQKRSPDISCGMTAEKNKDGEILIAPQGRISSEAAAEIYTRI